MARKPGVKRKPPTTRQETGPFCGAKRRPSGKPCYQPAGWRTDHPGVGRCRIHGGTHRPVKVPPLGATPSVLRRYSKIERHALRDLAERVAADEENVIDLAEEVHLLRAVLIQYVDNYEEFFEALMSWYAEPDCKVKPRRVMDISDVSHLIESVSRVVERMHKIKSEGSIDLVTFKRVTEQMGIIVAKHVADAKVLQRIETEWGSLALDAKPVPLPDADADDEPEEDSDGEED